MDEPKQKQEDRTESPLDDIERDLKREAELLDKEEETLERMQQTLDRQQQVLDEARKNAGGRGDRSV